MHRPERHAKISSDDETEAPCEIKQGRPQIGGWVKKRLHQSGDGGGGVSSMIESASSQKDVILSLQERDGGKGKRQQR